MDKISALAEFVAHTTEVKCAVISPKTKSLLATGGEDCKVNIWNMNNSSNVWALGNNKSAVEKICFDTDEQNIVSGAVNGSLKVFDLNEGRLARNLGGHKINVSSIMYHPYGEFIVSGSLDCTMKVWDVRNKSCIQTYTGHDKEVTCVRFSPDGKWVASAAKDGQLLIWDLVAGKVLQTLRIQPAYARTFEFHPSEFIIAAVTSARTVRLWDLESMAPLCSTSPDSSFVRAMAFVPGKSQLCSATKDGMKIWAWESSATASGSSATLALKLKGAASVPWEGVSDIRGGAEADVLLGCSCASNFVSTYSMNLTDLIRSMSIREGLGLAEGKGADGKRTPGGGEKERERPPFSVIGSPEAIPRSSARNASAGLASMGAPPLYSEDSKLPSPTALSPPRASSFASRYADSKSSPPSHLSVATGNRHGAKSIPAVMYHDRDDVGMDFKSPQHSGAAHVSAERGPNATNQLYGLPGGPAATSTTHTSTSTGVGDGPDDYEYDFEDDELFQGKGRMPSAAVPGKSVKNKASQESKSGKAAAVDMATSMSDSFLRVQLEAAGPIDRPGMQRNDGHDQRYVQPQSKYSTAACEAQVDRMLSHAPAFSSMLSTRLSSLRMLRRLWEKGELADVIDYLCNIHESSRHDPLQLCLLADFLLAVELRGNGLCLDSCVRLLPLLDGMLRGLGEGGMDGSGGLGSIGSGEHVVNATYRSLINLLEAFAELIRTTRQHSGYSGLPGAPVDLSREERLGKCNLCHSILMRIRGHSAVLRNNFSKSRRILDAVDRYDSLMHGM